MDGDVIEARSEVAVVTSVKFKVLVRVLVEWVYFVFSFVITDHQKSSLFADGN